MVEEALEKYTMGNYKGMDCCGLDIYVFPELTRVLLFSLIANLHLSTGIHEETPLSGPVRIIPR